MPNFRCLVGSHELWTEGGARFSIEIWCNLIRSKVVMMLVTFYIVAKCVVCALIQDCGHYTNLRGHTNMRHKGQISTDVHTASYSMRTVGYQPEKHRAVAQAVSDGLLTAEADVRFRASPCGAQVPVAGGSFCPEYFGFPLRVSFRQCSTLHLHATLTRTAGEGREPTERNALSLLGTAG